MKRYKLNFKVDEETRNGRIYPKDIIVKALEAKMKDILLVVLVSDNYCEQGLIKIENILGTVVKYYILENGEIEVDVLPNKMLEAIGDCLLTISGIGSVAKDGKTIEESYIMTALLVDWDSLGKVNATK